MSAVMQPEVLRARLRPVFTRLAMCFVLVATGVGASIGLDRAFVRSAAPAPTPALDNVHEASGIGANTDVGGTIVEGKINGTANRFSVGSEPYRVSLAPSDFSVAGNATFNGNLHVRGRIIVDGNKTP